MQALEKNYYSPHEYLELEVVSDIRSEYINGEIVPMTGGLPNHNQISLATSTQPYILPWSGSPIEYLSPIGVCGYPIATSIPIPM